MKPEIFLILFFTMAVSFAGCVGSDTPVPPAPAQQVITTGSPVPQTPVVTTIRQTATAIAKVTTTSPVPARIFNGDYHWAEYRNTVWVTMPPNPRSSWIYMITLERSMETFEGHSAIHYKITTVSDYPECCIDEVVTITKDGRTAVDDSYYETSTNRFLREARTGTIKGVMQPPENFSSGYAEHVQEASPAGDMGFVPFCEMNIALTVMGTESLTVPAGTYPVARKYAGSFLDGTPITFWVVNGVPVPVRYEFPNKYLDGEDGFESYELMRWG